MSNTGWDRSLGTSKQEQGIVTPQMPRRHHCGCWFIGKEMQTMCVSHMQGMNNIMRQLQQIAQTRKESDQMNKAASAINTEETAKPLE